MVGISALLLAIHRLPFADAWAGDDVRAGENVRADESAPTWENDLGPLFKRHCVKCHGPVKAEGKLNLGSAAALRQGGESGTVVAPHDLSKSLLWQRVRDDEMPPDAPLEAREKELVERWITAGAPGLQTADPKADHWAFRHLSHPQLSIAPSLQPARGPLDTWIIARLNAVRLQLNEDASKATAARRVALDLLGIPLAADELSSYLDEDSDDAYERMIDRTIASPRFGERWGKYWLDAAGYADSNGYFNADTDRPLAHRYRDYVIRTINRDTPFDRFVREQLAGDEFSSFVSGMNATPEIIEQLEATHFLRNGQDGSGESDGNPDEVRIDRYTALESSMQIVASSLLGLTIQCAKCHDHKFEPLTQREFYGFQAILYPVFNLEQWVAPNERFVLAPLPGERAAWERRQMELNAAIQAERNSLADWMRQHRPRGEVLFEDNFDNAHDSESKWSNTAPGDDRAGGEQPVQFGSQTAPSALVVDSHLQILESGGPGNRWLATRASIDWKPAGKGDAIQLTFDLLDDKVTADGSPAERIGYYIAAHDFHDRNVMQGGNLLIDGNPKGSTAVHLDYPGDDAMHVGQIGEAGYVRGRNYGVRISNLGDGKFLLEQLVDHMPEANSVTLSAEQLTAGGFAWEYCCGRSFVVDNVRIERFLAESEAAPESFQQYARQLKVRRSTLDALENEHRQLAKSPPGKIAWATDVVSKPPEVPFLERGNYADRRDAVSPAIPAVLADRDVALPLPQTTEASRSTGTRRAFAEWLTEPNSRSSALLARVHVNRLWQHHFGRGLVSTVENLGMSGAAPTHPELLEWLAGEFVRSDWSAKSLHRKVLLSTTYRQSTEMRPESALHDSDGRLWSRFPLYRLDAEAIRDMMLACSDDLDATMYGPYVPTVRDATGETVVSEDQPGARRRSLYLYQRRTQVLSLLAVFDSPSIVFNSISRPRSTMPLQALSLLNSEFVVNRARSLAQSLMSTALGEDRMIHSAYLRVLSRAPSSNESQAASEFLSTQMQNYQSDNNPRQRALADLCQMLMASNEFLYRE